MKIIFIFSIIFVLAQSTWSNTELKDFTIKTTSNESINLESYSKNLTLVVNIATRCGYTGQLEDIEKLYKMYKDQGLKVIGIPSNEFAGQTPESDQEVSKFCRLKYGTTFPISKKSVITGEKKIALYKYLINKTDKKEIQWNFTKFLIGKNAKSIKRFEPNISPLDPVLIKAIKDEL